MACIVVAGAGHAVATAVAAALTTRPLKAGHSRVSVLHLRRPGLRGTSDVWIYRPDVPDSSRLPVVYFLHGDPGQPADLFQAGLQRVLDRYVAQGGAPFVLAAPDGNSTLHDDTEWGDASDGSDEVEHFLLTTVIPAVEGRHPRAAPLRAIAGFSMGGYGAVNIALQHPELFAQIVSIAGYFHLDDPSTMFATPAARGANNPEANIARAAGKRILLLEDAQDSLTLIHGQAVAFANLLGHVPGQVVSYVGRGRHDLVYVMSQIPILARFLARGFAAARR